MDAEKLLQQLVDSEIGDHIREALVREILTDLRSAAHDDNREWADGTAEWLEENYL